MERCKFLDVVGVDQQSADVLIEGIEMIGGKIVGMEKAGEKRGWGVGLSLSFREEKAGDRKWEDVL